MYTWLTELYLILTKISASHGKRAEFTSRTGDLLNTNEQIEEESKAFERLINNIIEEIDTKTERLLWRLWRRLN